MAGYEPQLLLMISLHSVPWARATSLAQCGQRLGPAEQLAAGFDILQRLPAQKPKLERPCLC